MSNKLRLMDIEKACLLRDEREIYEQINIRKDLLDDMVGWLYPSIVNVEINKLYKRIEWLRDPSSDFQI